MRRSMSTIDKNDFDEDIVLKHSAYNTDEEFFVGELQDDSRADRKKKDAQLRGSFLPSFESGDEDFEDPDYLSFEQQDEMNSSTRDLPFEPIVEEVAEEHSHFEKQKALEAVEALSSLFELPSAQGKDHTRSPVSVRDLWEDHTRRNSETNSNTDESNRNLGSQSDSSPPQSRRSIFGACVSGKNEETAPSWSGFGIFSMDGRAAPESGNDENPSPRQFRALNKDDRANSLPPRLARKSSMKRIPSMQSSGTEEDSSVSVQSKSVKRTVSFGKLETREFSIALSDHPSCSYGPPISLGWDFRDKESVELEKYEERRSPRRQMHQMILSYNVRRYLLLKRAGYSNDELEQAMNEVDRVKRGRLVTDLLLPVSKIDETVEEVVRRMKSIFGGPPAE